VKPAEFDIQFQSPQVQAAAAFLRDAVSTATLEQALELAGVLSQLQADDELLLAACWSRLRRPSRRPGAHRTRLRRGRRAPRP